MTWNTYRKLPKWAKKLYQKFFGQREKMRCLRKSLPMMGYSIWKGKQKNEKET